MCIRDRNISTHSLRLVWKNHEFPTLIKPIFLHYCRSTSGPSKIAKSTVFQVVLRPIGKLHGAELQSDAHNRYQFPAFPRSKKVFLSPLCRLTPEVKLTEISKINWNKQNWLGSSFIFVGSTCGPSKIAKPTVFQVVLRGIGKSFQSAITAPRINLTGYGNATAQS